MSIDLNRFSTVIKPSRTLMLSNPADQPYYVDFSAVRGGKIIEGLERAIRFSPNDPTCQLFTGHIGCGKSTELFRLKADLEAQNYHVIYFEADQDLAVGDVDLTDILLAIARQVSQSLEAIGIRLKPSYFERLFGEISNVLTMPIDLKPELEFSVGIGKIVAHTKESPQVRSQLRQYLEIRTSNILESINTELLDRANQELKRRQKQGLVVIVDNLDRVENRPNAAGRSQPEYLFIDRGDQLRDLNCHAVYTIPLSLVFSDESQSLMNRLGGGVQPKVLPMVPTHHKDGTPYPEGMNLLRHLVLARAFPEIPRDRRLERISHLFDQPETLDRLCWISGGHIRNLLGLLYSCLLQQDPPFSADCLESVIRTYKDDIALTVKPEQWHLLVEVYKEKTIDSEASDLALLSKLFVFEYRGPEGRWFDLNPALREVLRDQ